MHIIERDKRGGRGSSVEYMTYSTDGSRSWTDFRLDAAPFETTKEASECCRDVLAAGARLRDVGNDGRTFSFQGYEVQIFKKGRSWQCRVGHADSVGGLTYRYGRKPSTTARLALNYGKAIVSGLGSETPVQ